MDFGMMPPEVNSGRMYAGPGPAPMLAAAAAWSRLAADLGSAASGYESVIAELTGREWLGPSAESMATAAAPYVAWTAATAAQAERTAAQLTAAVSAFEEAHAAVVPPPVIAANRSQLTSLIATNVLGQNSAAIAATETQYLQMWVQDVVAMSGYAVRSASAAAVTPFSQSPSVSNSAGSAAQAGEGAHSQLSQLLTAIPQALHGLSSTSGSPAALAGALEPLQSVNLPSTAQLASYVGTVARLIVPFNDAIKTLLFAMVQFSRNLMTDLDFAAAGQAAAAAGSWSEMLVATGAPELGSAGPVVSAGIGNASTVGKLAVPSGWVETAPAAKMAAAASPGTSAGAAPAAADLPTGVFADMALAGLAGRALAATTGRSRSASVASTMNGYAQNRLERMVTDLAGTHEVQHWHVEPSRLDDLLEELSEQPGVHAVHVNDDGTEPEAPQPSN